jgi:hypothetical protein
VPGYWKKGECDAKFAVKEGSAFEYVKKDAFTVELKLTLPPKTTGEKKTVVTFSLNRLNVQGNEPSSF